MLHGRLLHVRKTVTYLQILGCELHHNAFGGRAPSGPAGGAIARYLKLIHTAAPDTTQTGLFCRVWCDGVN